MTDEASVVLLGTRGTTSADGEQYAVYGRRTSCVLARIGGELIFLDAGSGILDGADYIGAERFSLLISHPHFDHLNGLPVFTPLFKPDTYCDIYGADRCGLSLREQLFQLMSPPLWPVTPDAFSENVRFLPLSERFSIGRVDVHTMESNHPGGTTHYRLDCGGKGIVYALDFEHSDYASARLAEFSADCDLLIYDAQYSDAEYENRRGWGHSTWSEGVKLAERCRAKRLILTHHSPAHTDAELSAVQLGSARASFAKSGEIVTIL